MYQDQSREQLRQMYYQAWQKHLTGALLEPVEAQIRDVVLLHPEYHGLLTRPDQLERDFAPEQGTTNPFLHMGLHIALREQIGTDRPAGIRRLHQDLLKKLGDAHAAEHRMMDCLADALWQAQRHGGAPDETAYWNCLRALLSAER